MRIVELRVSGFARLKAVEIRPDGALVPIVGKNDAGKSSVLKAIWTALKGRAVAPPVPIHQGAERAIIRLDLGDLVIERTFDRSDKAADGITTGLKVVMADGSRVRQTPQAVIDALLADLSFDPLAFAKMPPKEQFDRLKRLVPDVDFDDLAEERKGLFDQRTDAHRRHRDAQARADGVKLPAGAEPDPVDVSQLADNLRRAQGINDIRVKTLRQIADLEREAENAEAEIEELRSRAILLKRQVETATVKAGELRGALPEEMPTAEILDRMTSAQRITQTRALFEQRRISQGEADRAQREASTLDTDIAAIDERVRHAIAKAKLPAGLALDADKQIVTLNGLPLASAGTAKKIVASAQAAMALNPNLRVMLIDEGSELDSASLEMIEELATAHSYQIWLARVEEGEGGVGFRIEDGRLAQ